jgi:hypothetical protein
MLFNSTRRSKHCPELGQLPLDNFYLLALLLVKRTCLHALSQGLEVRGWGGGGAWGLRGLSYFPLGLGAFCRLRAYRWLKGC